jgi:hypothetical protein
MLPLNKFKLEDSEELFFRGVTQRKKYNLIYMEQLIKEEPKWKLVMDFDASALNVKPTDIIPVTDKLHDIISNEYDERITEKFKEYMRD